MGMGATLRAISAWRRFRERRAKRDGMSKKRSRRRWTAPVQARGLRCARDGDSEQQCRRRTDYRAFSTEPAGDQATFARPRCFGHGGRAVILPRRVRGRCRARRVTHLQPTERLMNGAAYGPGNVHLVTARMLNRGASNALMRRSTDPAARDNPVDLPSSR